MRRHARRSCLLAEPQACATVRLQARRWRFRFGGEQRAGEVLHCRAHVRASRLGARRAGGFHRPAARSRRRQIGRDQVVDYGPRGASGLLRRAERGDRSGKTPDAPRKAEPQCRWCNAAAVCTVREQQIPGRKARISVGRCRRHAEVLPVPRDLSLLSVARHDRRGNPSKSGSAVRQFVLECLENRIAVPGGSSSRRTAAGSSTATTRNAPRSCRSSTTFRKTNCCRASSSRSRR